MVNLSYVKNATSIMMIFMILLGFGCVDVFHGEFTRRQTKLPQSVTAGF